MSDTEISAQQIADAEKAVSQAASKISATTSTPATNPVWTPKNAMTTSVCILVFGLVVCFLAASLLKGGHSGDTVLKTLGTVVIIIGALFLMTAGYNDQQLTPIIGLLGTLAGYILGKSGNAQPPK